MSNNLFSNAQQAQAANVALYSSGNAPLHTGQQVDNRQQHSASYPNQRQTHAGSAGTLASTHQRQTSNMQVTRYSYLSHQPAIPDTEQPGRAPQQARFERMYHIAYQTTYPYWQRNRRSLSRSNATPGWSPSAAKLLEFRWATGTSTGWVLRRWVYEASQAPCDFDSAAS